ncbi:MAG: DUF4127 family protein [Microcystis aeruginosa LG13-11]|nr:DUF4127 family protein [Microcystis aeruginosa LG13-11]
MMTTQKLKALVNTVIKQSTLDSSQITDLTQKFSLTAGDELEINDYKSAANNHWELELTTPVNEMAKWFAYIPHVEIKSNDPMAKILQDIKLSQFKVYHGPTEQDGDGVGIPTNGQDNRSERICPVYVLSPRRQTDSLVRQLITLLRVKDTAFIIAERLVQYPEDYLPTISQFQKAVIVQSFVGVGPPQPDATPYPDWAKERHDKELWRLEQSIRLLQSMNRKISAVVCAMGDSQKHSSKDVRKTMQTRLDNLLDKYNLSALKQPITWGADELVAMGIAQTLPKTKVRVRISNEETEMWYDGRRPPRELVTEKLQAVGLEESETGWDFEVAILTRRQNGSIDDYQKDDQEQAQLDEQFLAQYKNYSSEQRAKLVIIDGRLFNGAWNATSVLPHDDLLAFGSWGTFGNCVGSTLAVAKILFYAKNPAAQRQLYLEAIAHDVFANGYKEVQRPEEPKSFCNQLKNQTGITFKHYDGYDNPATVKKVFEVLNRHVNVRMQEHFAGLPLVNNRVFRITPQFWRTFESEVHIWPRLPEEIHKVGIYRTDLEAIAFNPSLGDQFV